MGRTLSHESSIFRHDLSTTPRSSRRRAGLVIMARDMRRQERTHIDTDTHTHQGDDARKRQGHTQMSMRDTRGASNSRATRAYIRLEGRARKRRADCKHTGDASEPSSPSRTETRDACLCRRAAPMRLCTHSYIGPPQPPCLYHDVRAQTAGAVWESHACPKASSTDRKRCRRARETLVRAAAASGCRLRARYGSFKSTPGSLIKCGVFF